MVRDLCEVQKVKNHARKLSREGFQFSAGDIRRDLGLDCCVATVRKALKAPGKTKYAAGRSEG